MDMEEGRPRQTLQPGGDNSQTETARPAGPFAATQAGVPSDVWAWPGQSQSTIYGRERNRPIGIQGRWWRKADRANELRVPSRGGAARSFKSTAVGEEPVLVFGSRVSGREVSAGTLRA